MSNLPLVSVVIPAYNAELTIEDAVKSIINQTYKNIEIIIVNDGSQDNTLGKLKKLANSDNRVILIDQPNGKISNALNNGVKLAKGKYIARMDADDHSSADRIQKQVEFLETNKRCVIVGAYINVCDNNMNLVKSRRYPITDREIRKQWFYYSPFAHPAVMYRKSEFIKAGKYNESLNGVEDYDLYFRLSKFGEMANIPETLLNLRLISTSISASSGVRQENLTLYVRLKAIFEYGIKIRGKEKLYFLLQVFSKLLPYSLKFKIYMRYR